MPSSTSTNYCANAWLGQLLKNTSYSPPSSLWLALFTTAPSLTGTGGVEVSTSGTGYGRVEIQANSGWNGPSGNHQEYSNAQELAFQVPTANWGTVVAGGLYDASTGGNLYYVFALTSSKTVNNGDGAPRVLQGQLRISRAVC